MRSLKHLESDEVVIDKWGYAILAGVLGTAAASEPGGLSTSAGFALGFLSTFVGLFLLEVAAERSRVRRLHQYSNESISGKLNAIVVKKAEHDLIIRGVLASEDWSKRLSQIEAELAAIKSQLPLQKSD